MSVVNLRHILPYAERMGIAVGEADVAGSLRRGVSALLSRSEVADAVRARAGGLPEALDQFVAGEEIEAGADELANRFFQMSAAVAPLLPFSSFYQIPSAQNWQGRVDGADDEHARRFHQHVGHSRDFFPGGQLPVSGAADGSELFKGRVGNIHALLGFASDLGVRANLGRPGANRGPDAIRAALAGLPVVPQMMVFDAGNIIAAEDVLGGNPVLLSQIMLGRAVAVLHGQGMTPIVLGGGNDLSYGHWLGLMEALPQDQRVRVGVINVAAHWDLRSVDERGVSSGTPFWQMARRARVMDDSGGSFPYLAIGIQETANTGRLVQTAAELGARVVMADELTESRIEGALTTVRGFLEGLDLVYLAINLDAFQAGAAPGVSAANPDGIVPGPIFYRLFDSIARSKKVAGFDVTEMSPANDALDGRTAKLAARLIHRFIARSR